MAGGRQGPEQVLGWSHLSSGPGQAAAAVSGPRQPRVTVRVGSLHREHVPQCPGYNGRNSELKFNHWCWSKLVSDLLIVFPNPIL